jgi:AcrR family transcriptional regulator
MPKTPVKARTSPRRGRPRLTADDEDAFRAKVMEQARRLFAQDGVAAVSMRRIAVAVGCSPMAIYRYFSSRDEILRGIWGDFFDDLFARLEPLARRRGPARRRLLALCRAYLDYWFEHPDRFRMIYLHQDQIAPGERYYVDASAIVERYWMFMTLIAEAQAEGDAPAGNTERLGEALLCLLHGIALNLITIPEYPWQDRETLLRAALAGVLPGRGNPDAQSA